MRCHPHPHALSQQLRIGSAPVYFLYGNEPFLIEESIQLIRKQLQSLGNTERVVLHWDNNSLSKLYAVRQNRSLFAQTQLIEIYFKNLTAEEEEAFYQLLKTQPPDTYFLIQTTQLSRTQQHAQWYQLIEQQGVVIAHWPLGSLSFQKWIKQRALMQGLNLSQKTLALICYYAEGNCLIAAQEIDRLCLLTQEEITLSQQSQFTVFELCEAALQQQPVRVIKIMRCLKETEKVPLPLIIWALGQCLRNLLRCRATSDPGKQRQILQQAGIRARELDLYLKVLKAGSTDRTHLLTQWSQADRQLKTGALAAAWNNVFAICLSLAGINLSTQADFGI